MSLSYQHFSKQDYNDSRNIPALQPLNINPYHQQIHVPHSTQKPHLEQSNSIQHQQHDNRQPSHKNQDNHKHDDRSPSHQHQHDQHDGRSPSHYNCSGCYANRLENDINRLLAQMKHGEQCYDQLRDENQNLKSQIETLHKEALNIQGIQKELHELHQNMTIMKNTSQDTSGLYNQLQLKKLEIDQLKEDLKEFYNCRQEINSLRQNNTSLQDELSRFRYLDELHHERGNKIKLLEQNIKDLIIIRDEKEQLLGNVSDLTQSLQNYKNDNSKLKDLLYQYKDEIQRLRQIPQQVIPIQQVIPVQQVIPTQGYDAYKSPYSASVETYLNTYQSPEMTKIKKLQTDNDNLNAAVSNYVSQIRDLQRSVPRYYK